MDQHHDHGRLDERSEDADRHDHVEGGFGTRLHEQAEAFADTKTGGLADTGITPDQLVGALEEIGIENGGPAAIAEALGKTLEDVTLALKEHLRILQESLTSMARPPQNNFVPNRADRRRAKRRYRAPNQVVVTPR